MLPDLLRIRVLLATAGLPSKAPWAWLEMRRGRGTTLEWLLANTGGHVAGESELSWPWPPRHKDQVVTLFGVERQVDTWPVPWPCWTLQTEARGVQPGDWALHIYLSRAHHPLAVTYAELRWHATLGFESAIRNAEDASMDDLRRAQVGLRLLQHLPLGIGGRPKGSGTFAERSEFEAMVRPVVRGLIEQGERPTQERVADFLSEEGFKCDPRLLRRWCREFGLPWDQLVGS